jgi:hypothetical protein
LKAISGLTGVMLKILSPSIIFRDIFINCNSIAQTGVPHFKSFWDARTICLNLFKENIPPALRSILWAKYNELSKEATQMGPR